MLENFDGAEYANDSNPHFYQDLCWKTWYITLLLLLRNSNCKPKELRASKHRKKRKGGKGDKIPTKKIFEQFHINTRRMKGRKGESQIAIMAVIRVTVASGLWYNLSLSLVCKDFNHWSNSNDGNIFGVKLWILTLYTHKHIFAMYFVYWVQYTLHKWLLHKCVHPYRRTHIRNGSIYVCIM